MSDILAQPMFDGPEFTRLVDARAALAEWEGAPPSRERDLHLGHIRAQLPELEALERELAEG